MRITRIEPQKKRPGRKNIYADGEFVAGVSDETLVRLGLRTGDELTPEKLGVIHSAEELFSAKHVALRYLSHRPRTVREVRDRLREKEFGDEEIQKTLQELQQSGLLNDCEFARMFVRDALALKPSGRLALRQKMLRLGLEKLLVEETLTEAFAATSQHDLALEAAQKFLRKITPASRNQDALKLRNKLGAFLARRGFTWDVISSVLRQVMSDQQSEEDI